MDSTVKTFLNLAVVGQSSCDLNLRQKTLLGSSEQESANIVKKQLKDLRVKLQTIVQRVFTSREIAQEFPTSESKPQLIDQQCVVYNFVTSAMLVGYTRGHLFVRVDDGEAKVQVTGHRTGHRS